MCLVSNSIFGMRGSAVERYEINLLIYEVTGGPKNLDNSIYLVNRRLARDQPNGGNWYDVIEMCAPAAPPIMLRIRTRSLNPNPKP